VAEKQIDPPCVATVDGERCDAPHSDAMHVVDHQFVYGGTQQPHTSDRDDSRDR